MDSSLIPETARGIFEGAQQIAFDTIVVVTLVLVFLIYALYFGKGKVLSVLFSFYIAALLFDFFPFLSLLGQISVINRASVELVLYLGLLLISIFATRNCIRAEFRNGTVRRIMMAGLFAFSGALFALAITWRALPNISDIHQFGPPIVHLINPISVSTWWILTLPVLLAFTIRGKSKNG